MTKTLLHDVSDIVDASGVLDSAAAKDRVAELTSYLMHKHYCENDPEALIELFDRDQFSWLGAAEHEYAIGCDTVTDIFRQFTGLIPSCNISDEEYHVLEVAPATFLCSGRAWIATDPSTKVSLRVHQRITTLFRVVDGFFSCCHIHISNPYVEMVPEDVGFPTNMARQSYDYLQERLAEEVKKTEAQASEIKSMYDTVPCAILRFLRVGDRYRLVAYNDAVRQLVEETGVPFDVLDWSKGYCEFVEGDDVAKIEGALESLQHPGDNASVVWRLVGPEGNEVYIDSRNMLVSSDENGDVIQRISLDVTKRVELEQALVRMSYEDVLTGLFNRTRFTDDVSDCDYGTVKQLGIACFDINGLKPINDRLGHLAGDDLIRRTANHLKAVFEGKAYRIGGDEFVIVDDESDEASFLEKVATVREGFASEGISVAGGVSWRAEGCGIEQQIDEADRSMYQEKSLYYQDRRHDRRKR